jgi:hypothetical protein
MRVGISHWWRRLLGWLFSLGQPWDLPRLEGVRVGYQKAGLTVFDEPIPWNADGTLVEILVRCPARGGWSVIDFCARLEGRPSVGAIDLHHDDDGVVRLVFRLPPPCGAEKVTIYWQTHVLADVALPYLAVEDFLGGLRLESPVVFAHVGQHHVACQALVEGQSRGLVASALVVSRTRLLPLLDLDLTVDFIDHASGQTEHIALPLSGVQAGATQAILNAVWTGGPAGVGTWFVRFPPLVGRRSRAGTQRRACDFAPGIRAVAGPGRGLLCVPAGGRHQGHGAAPAAARASP